MNVHLDCPQCGRLLRVNEQFAGRMVRCPSCGTAYVAPSPRDAPPRGRPTFDDSPAGDLHAPCEGCGVLTRVSTGGGPARCPNCRSAGPPDVYPLKDSAPSQAIFAPASPPPTPTDVVPADGPPPPQEPRRPKADGPPCPECGEPMAGDGVICLGCGFNRATGKRLKTVARRLAARWDAGDFPLAARLVVFLVVVAASPLLPLAFADPVERQLLVFLVVCVVVSSGALVLGTFHRLTVTTDPRGTPILIRKMWVCFIPISSHATDLADFRTIRLALKESGVGPAAFLLAVGLCVVGGLAALLWHMRQSPAGVYTVDIVARRGADGQPIFEPVTLYRGRSERTARGIGDALEQIAGLRYG